MGLDFSARRDHFGCDSCPLLFQPACIIQTAPASGASSSSCTAGQCHSARWSLLWTPCDDSGLLHANLFFPICFCQILPCCHPGAPSATSALSHSFLGSTTLGSPIEEVPSTAQLGVSGAQAHGGLSLKRPRGQLQATRSSHTGKGSSLRALLATPHTMIQRPLCMHFPRSFVKRRLMNELVEQWHGGDDSLGQAAMRNYRPGSISCAALTDFALGRTNALYARPRILNFGGRPSSLRAGRRLKAAP